MKPLTFVLALSVAAAPALLAAAPQAPAAAVAARPPDGTYRYELRKAGTPIGSSRVVFRQDGNTVVVTDDFSLAALHLNAHVVARYDASSLSPVGYHAEVTLPNGSQATDVAAEPGRMTVRVPGQTVAIPADAGAPLEVASDNFPGTLVVLPAILAAQHAQKVTLAVLAGARAIVDSTVPAGDVTRPSGVSPSDVVLALEGGGLRLNFWYAPSTYVVDEIDIPAQQASIVRTGYDASTAPVATPTPAPTPLPTETPHYRSDDVSFASADGTRLAGTLTIPDGRGPFPALVLVAGSGPQDRDERVGPNAIFLQLANVLSNAGYAVLRYDKRGVGASGRGGAPTRDAFLGDVRAAFAFARARPEVDPKRLYLLGHSEGGELVPTVAAHDPRVAGIVLMAPPADSIARILMQQVLASVPADKREQARRDELSALEKIRKSTDGGTDAWLRTSMDVDPIVDVARVRCPILILQGGRDSQVLAKNLPRLLHAAHGDVTVRVFPDDDHLFEPIPADRATNPEAALDWYLSVPERVDPAVTSTLLHWLRAHTA
ncbi:MAG TPA: alpha/beta fold hydrolase [Candidatus Baltobacteraceae bacterium]|nr:alpha/beta fold hydrolase [Candidatus Baltobacteraceae bacterium]